MSVVVFGRDLTSLDEVPALASVRELAVIACPIRSIAPLAACAQLEKLELAFTFVEDLAPLVALPNLRDVRVYGNPLDDRSFHETIPALRARAGRPPTVWGPFDDEWQVCRELAARGAPLVYGLAPPRGLLVSPGPGRTLPVDLRFIDVDGVRAIAARRPRWTADELLAQLATGAAAQATVADLRTDWMAGDRIDVAAWARAATWLDGADGFARFAERLPSLPFYRESAARYAARERVHDVTLPAWFARVRTEVFAGFQPEMEMIEVHLGRLGWYRIGWVGYENTDLRRHLLDERRLFPIGEIDEARELGHSVLAIRLDEADTAIYQLDPRADAPPRRAFDRYPDLWDAIDRVRVRGVVVDR